MHKLTFITSNRGKFEELRARLDQVGIDSAQKQLRYPEVQANSLLEVTEAAMGWLAAQDQKGPYVIEDSGLFIDDLRGFPGVFSAHAFATIGIAGILALLEDRTRRDARFESCIGYCDKEGNVSFFVGACHGTIALAPKGDQGFGFDPVFKPEGSDRTFGQMDCKEKTSQSHRGMAVDRLVNHLLGDRHADTP